MILIHASSADGHWETSGGGGREGGQFLFVQGTSVLHGKTEKAHPVLSSAVVRCWFQAALQSSSNQQVTGSKAWPGGSEPKIWLFVQDLS